MENRMTQERFLRDAKDLQLTVMHEHDVYRHLLMKKPGSSAYHYSVVTFPGFLVMTGDMGAWTFQRLHDMFEFFRTGIKADGTIRTNLGYWSEKLVALDGNRSSSGCKEFDPDEFRRVVLHERRKLVQSRERQRFEWMDHPAIPGTQIPKPQPLGKALLTKEQRRDLWEAIEDDVLSLADEGEERAMAAAMDFGWSHDGYSKDYYFPDFYEHECKRYTHSFEWACFAIPHAIAMYDAHKEATKPPAPAPVPAGEDDDCPF